MRWRRDRGCDLLAGHCQSLLVYLASGVRTPERMARHQANLNFLRTNSLAHTSVLSPLVVADGWRRRGRAESFRLLQGEACSAGYEADSSGEERTSKTAPKPSSSDPLAEEGMAAECE